MAGKNRSILSFFWKLVTFISVKRDDESLWLLLVAVEDQAGPNMNPYEARSFDGCAALSESGRNSLSCYAPNLVMAPLHILQKTRRWREQKTWEMSSIVLPGAYIAVKDLRISKESYRFIHDEFPDDSHCRFVGNAVISSPACQGSSRKRDWTRSGTFVTL